MRKTLLFIINPIAGRGQIRQPLLDILRLFSRYEYDVIVRTTEKRGQAVSLVDEFAERADLIVCSGGDGTLDEVVEGTMHHSKEITVGYIPCGSTNDFANSLFMPKDPLAAARNIMEGKIYHCDVGSFNEHYFIYIAAFGLFTEVSYETPQDWKNALGHLAYILEGAMKLFDIKSYEMKVEANGKVLEGRFIYGMITNSRSVGGIKNVPRDVDMNDGLFEVTLIEMPKDPSELQEIVTSLVMQNDNSRLVHIFKSREITIQSPDKCPWTLDGEYGGNPEEIRITNLNEALHLKLSSTKPVPNEDALESV